MELSPYLEALRRDLVAAAAPGGPEVTSAAELMGGSLEASARLCLLEALSDAAAEITTKLTNNAVEVRLRGREAQFVVTESEPAPTVAPTVAPEGGATDQPSGASTDGELARITLRIPEGLKEAVERAAALEGISVNAWLVRAIAHVVAGPPPGPGFPPPGFPPPGFPPGRGRMGRRVTGYAQA